MAYLLGAAAVMESLQRDVRDIQTCVADIISRVGPVQSTSWKFPDKIASDLDIEDLLDLYSYSEDVEERQVAHIALYELVIDRLVLLLHAMASYTEMILKTSKTNEVIHVTGTSVGVVVKKYWSCLSQIQQLIKNVVQEKNTMSRKVSEMESEVQRLDSELKQAYTASRTVGFGGLIPPNRAEMMTGMSLDISQLKKFGLISKDEYNKSCQTSETAFTPCDSCSMVQKSFRQCGEIVVNICQQQQIPSCLQKFRPQVSHLDWLSGNDISRWSVEQQKDLQRISKLTATIKPLKDELAKCQETIEKLEKRVLNFDRDMKHEKDDRAALNKQYELKLKQIEEQHTQTLELEKQQRDLLEKNQQELQRLLEKHKSELLQKQSLLQEMESTKCKIEDELSSNKVNESEVKRLEKEMSQLQTRLDDVADKMEQSARDLQREQAKNKSVSKHTQSLQSKQESLLIRIEVLDDENKELKEQLTEIEEKNDEIEKCLSDSKWETTQREKQLKEKENEIESLMADKESLEHTITTLETTMQSLTDKLQEVMDRERLIIEYPDINGRVNPDITGTGDIVLDMENQVKANNVRIQLLETQNEGLRNSISKLTCVQQQQEFRTQDVQNAEGDGQRWATNIQRIHAQPLWDPNYLHCHDNHKQSVAAEYKIENTAKQSNTDNMNIRNQSAMSNITKKLNQSGIKTLEFDNTVKQNNTVAKDRSPFGHKPLSGNNSKKQKDEFIVGKAQRPESVKMKQEHTTSSLGNSRPASGKTYINNPSSCSIGAYLQLKKEGKIGVPRRTVACSSEGSRPATSQAHIPTSNIADDYIKQDNFICENCDKMYTKQRDLEIHKSYCTG